MSLLEVVQDEGDLLPILSNEQETQQLLKEIDARIALHKSYLTENAIIEPEAVPQADDSDLNEQGRIIETLKDLRAGFDEVDYLSEEKSILSAYEVLDQVSAKVTEFANTHPGSLLSGDLRNKADGARAALGQRLVNVWNKFINVSMDSNKAVIKVVTGYDDDIKSVLKHDAFNLIEALLASIGKILDNIINLNVSLVEEEDDSITLHFGPVTTIDVLIDSVQSFTLGLSNIFESQPELLERITRRFGRTLINGLTRKSLLALFPRSSEGLELFERDLRGIQGLEEVLISISWTSGTELAEFAANFPTMWQINLQTVYLDKLRMVLEGTLKQPKIQEPEEEGDGWGWDGIDDEEFEDKVEPETEDKVDEVSTSEAVISVFHDSVAETGQKVDSLLSLYRALAPGHYGEENVVFYADTMRLLSEISPQNMSEQESTRTRKFATTLLASFMTSVTRDMDIFLSSISFVTPPSNLSQSILEKVQNAAEQSSVAGPQVRSHTLSQLVEQVAHQLIQEVLRLEDIGEDQSNDLSHIIKGLRGLGAYFDDVANEVPSWIKLERLGDILQSNLATISTMFESSMLVDFSAEELETLVVALFVDSDKRQDLLNEIYTRPG